MAANELKLYLTEHVLAGLWDIDENTFHHKWKVTVKRIAALKEKKIKFDPLDFPAGQVFLMSVDGVNFTSSEPRAENPGSHWMITNHTVLASHMRWQLTFDVAEFNGLMDLGQVRSVAIGG